MIRMGATLFVVGLVACGPKPAPVPPAKQFAETTRPAEEIASCGLGCERIAACWQAGWGEAMPDDRRATCESDCLTALPEEGDAWMAKVGAETSCAELVESPAE